MQRVNISNDQQLSLVQDNVIAEFNRLPFDFPVLRGTLVEAMIGAVDTPINHGLQRPLEGWLLVDKNANADVWRSATVNPRPQDQIILIATATVTVKLYFF